MRKVISSLYKFYFLLFINYYIIILFYLFIFIDLKKYKYFIIIKKFILYNTLKIKKIISLLLAFKISIST